MLWLGTSPHEPSVSALLDGHEIGLLCQPKSHPAKPGWIWAADNGCFSTTGRWDEGRWLDWLARPHPRSGCLFATVPDVVGDHDATLALFPRYADQVRGLRYPVAFVAQDGATESNTPWDEFDCLFVGGTTEWKQGEAARELAIAARSRSRWVHVGRVNSLRRLLHWSGVADSSDGTLLAFGPQKNSERVRRWLESLRAGQQQRLEVSA